MEQIKRPHTVHLENDTLKVTGVKNVLQFDDNEITLELFERALNVSGSGLAVSKLDVSDGVLTVSGKIQSITYDKAHVPFLKRVFK